MAHKITAVADKTKDWKVVSILNAAGEIVQEVSVNRTNKKGEIFPEFDSIVVGADIAGQMWQSPAGKMYLFPPKDSPKKDSSPAARGSDGSAAEIKNILKLTIQPLLETIRKDQIAILGKLGMDDEGYDKPPF